MIACKHLLGFNNLRFLSRSTIEKLPQSSKSTPKRSKKNDGDSKIKIEKISSSPETSSREKLKKLEEKANKFLSIGPRDQKTINKITAKPKIFIRQSARPPRESNVDEKLKNIDDETVQTLSKGLDRRLVEAAQRIARRLPKHLSKRTEEDLLESLQKNKEINEEETKKRLKERENYSNSFDILRKRSSDASIFDENDNTKSIKSIIPSKTRKDYNERLKKTSLFSGECLGIFDPKEVYTVDLLNHNAFWEKLEKRKLQLQVHDIPENHFEEQIRWTKEGKLWHFPIDNEQGLHQEKETPFYDHVLLDNLLDDFPQQGPVKQFMDLVIMGLSQNPFISVQRKRETVLFYKNFFEERNLMDTSQYITE
ncbi:hypothetical protein SSS_00360 [Sarcoptes scabiei]|nr:hypothetical protein SSS_00360 [Sarcoptes scabiei]